MGASRDGFCKQALGRRRSGVALVAAITCCFPLVTAVPAAARGAGLLPVKALTERVIVVFRDQVGDPRAVLGEHRLRFGLGVYTIFEHVFHGYAAEVPIGARRLLELDPRVAHVEEDQRVEAFGEVPTGVDRIQADTNATAAIDGEDSKVSVDIAILDTGISRHPDLVIAGGIDCSRVSRRSTKCEGTSSSDYKDGNGHGTHVAGIAAARDNGRGVVGVAPGARLWAVRVLDSSGGGTISGIVAGIDWVTSKASTIEVANMSLGCRCASAALDQAIARSTAAGVVYVAAAGNSASDASTTSPGNHPSVISVSAMTDFDGKAGGLGRSTCRAGTDDSFASFSNFGPTVDLAAPGVCILSTSNDKDYEILSGTSMASPLVAGAAALYVVYKKVPRNSSRAAAVRTGLLSDWAVPQSSTCGFTAGRSSEKMLMLGPCP
jgi:subtilisin family serine protease